MLISAKDEGIRRARRARIYRRRIRRTNRVPSLRMERRRIRVFIVAAFLGELRMPRRESKRGVARLLFRHRFRYGVNFISGSFALIMRQIY